MFSFILNRIFYVIYCSSDEQVRISNIILEILLKIEILCFQLFYIEFSCIIFFKWWRGEDFKRKKNDILLKSNSYEFILSKALMPIIFSSQGSTGSSIFVDIKWSPHFSDCKSKISFFCLWSVNKKLHPCETHKLLFRGQGQSIIMKQICMLEWAHPSLSDEKSEDLKNHSWNFAQIQFLFFFNQILMYYIV